MSDQHTDETSATVPAVRKISAHLHSAYDCAPRPMRVVSTTRLTPDITHMRLVSAEGSPLRPYVAGSHLIVTAGAHRNAYSLVDDGLRPDSYGISVLRRAGGGGSQWLHDNIAAGDVIEVEGPRSMFAPVSGQRRVLLVAGGIGVTPILSHARAALRDGVEAEIIYSHRRGHGAHLPELRALAARDGVTLHEVCGRERTRAVMYAAFARQPLGTHAYACGPASLLDTYIEMAAQAGWPGARVHLERFAAPEHDAGEPFTVTIVPSGAVIEVPAGTSLLHRLLESGVAVPHMCRQGVCGECRITVRSGRVDHRDCVLTDDEKAAGDTMLCCVSRGTDLEVQP